MTSWPVRLAASAGLACAIAFLVYLARPDELDVRTDIVGYPTFANFDIDSYLWAYGLAVVLFPLLATALYLALTRVLVGSKERGTPVPAPLERVEPVPAPTGRREWATALGRTLFVGGVLGIEAAAVVRPDEPLDFAAALTIAYATVVVLGAALVSRVSRAAIVELVNVVTVLVTPLTITALYAVSDSTRVTVDATGVVHRYAWLPAWLALGMSAAVFAWLARRLVQSPTHAERSDLARRALLLVVAPVALFLFLASLPGALGTVSLFEEGQVLVGAELTREGAFPWRDLLMAHGLLHDVGQGFVGTEVFEDSRWGLVAGGEMLLEPLYWIGLYFLCTYLFGANWLFLLGTQLLVVTGHIFATNIRFALLPFVLLLLAVLLARPTAGRAGAFTALLAVQVLVTPEAMAAAVAYVGVLAVFDLYYYERGSGFAAGFRRTWLCLGTAGVLAVVWSLFLLANGALDDWVFSFTTFLPGHQLTGGIPLLVLKHEFEVIAPIVLVLVAFAFLVVWTRLQRALALPDWVMLATAALTCLYYPKFLNHADAAHMYQSFSVAVPLLFYVAYRFITLTEPLLARLVRPRVASWFPARHTVTLPVLIALLVAAPVSLRDAARAAPIHFSVTAPRDPQIERIGFDRSGENDEAMVRDVARTIVSLLEPGETVFDFSNSPGLYHYLLDLQPGTRYYHVSLAIRQRTQSDLLRRLEEARPSVVVYTSDDVGLPIWDGVVNQVRHYDVSEYLLERYVPVLDSHGFVLMTRRDAKRGAVPELYFHADPCDWGYVPNFFSPAPAASAEAVKLRFRRLEAPQRLAVTLPADAAAYGWLEVRTGEPLAQGRFELSDRPGGNARRSIAFETLDRGQTSVRVKVGACSQWRGYRPGTFYLTSSVPQDIREIRLVR